MSRYCVFRYCVTKTRYRDFFPDIGTDIGKKDADIGTISGHTRSLPNPILPISGPISGFFPISVPISGQYRDIPVPCQTRYRVYHRYRARYGPDIAKNIGIYGYLDQKNSISFPMSSFFVCNIAIYRYRVPAAPPPPACRTGPDSDSEATVQAATGPACWSSALQTKGAVPWVLPTCLRTACYCRNCPGLGWCNILRVTGKT